jgi:hypothetical protein
MSRKELKNILNKEMGIISKSKNFQKWHSTKKDNINYIKKVKGHKLQVEINILEIEKDYVHIGVCVDDGKFWNTLMPVSSSFIICKDGRIEK